MKIVHTFGLSAALLIVLGVPADARAQYKIDAWTTEHGLPQSTVSSVTQTPDGFIWFATLGGLVRFDGIRFRVYDTVTNPELPTSRLLAPLIDKGGEFWVATEDKRVLRFRNDRFEMIGPEQGLPARPFTRIRKRGGIVSFWSEAGEFTWQAGRFQLDQRPGPPATAGLTYIGDVFGGARWFLDANGLAHRYEGDRETRTMRLPSDRGDLVYEDREGRLWMRNISTGRLICVIGDKVHRYGPADGVVGMSTMWTLEDPDGTLWFAEATGLVRFRNGEFRSFTKEDGLPSSFVNGVFRDREGTHWVSTQGGLARLTEQPIASFSKADGLAARNIYPVLQDRRGDIWIGGWTGLTRYRNGRFEDVSRAAGLVNRNVFSLLETSDGVIWVATGGVVTQITIGPGGEIHPTMMPVRWDAFAMYQCRNGDIWFGTTGGARRYRDGKFEPWLTGMGGVNTFYEDSKGVLWIGSAAGLARLDGGKVTSFGERDGFTGKQVRVIHRGADDTLWIGTYDSGLFRYRDGVFTRFTTRDGLPVNGAFQILEDDGRRFWISSNSGIYRVAVSELDEVAAGRRMTVTSVQFGRADGMLNQECNGLGRPAGVKAADGRLWFPTQDGVVAIDPAAMASRPAPPVVILDVSVGGTPIPSHERVEIRSGSTSIDVQFAALTFVRPDLVQFRYRLEGFESEWHSTVGADRIARYAKLPYGRFRLRVTAANRDGVWNEAGASLPIDVVPPFWRTGWFAALIAGLVIAAGLAVHRARLGILERRQAIQEAFARRLIDTQESDRMRIAAGLHNSLAQSLMVIKNWAHLGGATDAPEKIGPRFAEIEQAATHALTEVRDVVQDLAPYHIGRIGLAESVREMTARLASATGIEFTCRLDAARGQLSPDAEVSLFRIIQEGLNNVVKHAGAAHVSLDLDIRSDRLVVLLRDDGRGFVVQDAAEGERTSGGFGLVWMSERARLLGGRLTIDSQPGHGATIAVELPVMAEPVEGRA